MTSPEQSDNKFEHITDGWSELDPYVQRLVRSAAVSVEFANAETVQRQLLQLNNYFVSEGLISLPARVKTGLPTFMSVSLDEDGVQDIPVVDAELIGKKEYEGIFRGCVIREVAGDQPMNLLFYDIELEHDRYQPLRINVLVDEANVQVLYPETDNWDEEVAGAFAVLETVDDEEYQATVEGLQEAFYDTDQPMELRLTTLGIHATVLLAHEKHVESGDIVEALGEILMGSLDEELLYSVRGYAVDETRKEDGRPVVAVTKKQKDRIVKPVGIRYVTNFEITQADNKTIDIQLTNALQPAFVFYDVKEDAEFYYPLRYIANVKEFDYNDEQAYDISEASVRYTYGAIGQKTCGELSHEFNRRIQ